MVAHPIAHPIGIRVAALSAAMALVLSAALTTPDARRSTADLVSVIVQALDPTTARDAVERNGGEVTGELPIVDGVVADVPADRIDAVRASAGVRAVSEDEEVFVQGSISPVHSATAVYPQAVGADRLWQEGVDGDGVTVAVMDTGIADVPDLAGRLVGGVDFSGENAPFRDSFGHGTFVAGLIAGNGTSSAGRYTGVAPDTRLVSIKIAGRDGASDVSHVLAGIQWAVSFKDQYGIKVLNVSLGTDSTQRYELSPLNYAVQRAWDSGIVVVVSASNRGPGAGTVTKPGDDPLVVTVGSSDDKGTPGLGDDVVAGFSGQGPTRSNGINKPDVLAPGRSVVSLRAPGSKVDGAYPGSRVDGAYFKGSGTSFSTAVASGAVALLVDREPGLTPDQVKHRLLANAAPAPVADPNVAGHGLLDVNAAAHAGTFESANQGIPRGTGLGTLDADRGTLDIEIQTGTITNLLGQVLPVLKLLTGETTAQDVTFDALAYTTSEWNGSTWYGSTWYGSTWYGSTWYGSTWYGSTWYGSTWYAAGWE